MAWQPPHSLEEKLSVAYQLGGRKRSWRPLADLGGEMAAAYSAGGVSGGLREMISKRLIGESSRLAHGYARKCADEEKSVRNGQRHGGYTSASITEKKRKLEEEKMKKCRPRRLSHG